MANSTPLQDRQGPDWPLGFISVATPGTPVPFMNLVDPTGKNNPNNPNTATPGAEFTHRAQQIQLQGFKPGATHGMQNNTGNVYIVRTNAATGGGTGNRDDTSVMVTILSPGQTIYLASGATVNDVWSPYRYSVDADNAGDGALITLLIF